MIGYRLLPQAEEEMTEAALFYESARLGFGGIFLDDIQRAIAAADKGASWPHRARRGTVARAGAERASCLPLK